MATAASSGDDGRSLGFWSRTGFITPMARDHTHADIELNYLFSGSLRYFLGGRFLDVPPRRLVAFWAAIPHQAVDAGERTEIGWVCVPLGHFLRFDLGRTALTRLLAGDLVVDRSEHPEDEARIRQWAVDFASGDPYEAASFELEVQARLRRLLRTSDHVRTAPSHGASARVEALAAWIGEHFREEMSLAEIGAAVGLHPNYAMSLFRTSCGMSIWRYVTRLRLAHAQRLLATSDLTTLAIAMESGFGSSTRFYEAFRRDVGIPPGEFRRRQRAPATPPR